MLKTLWIGTRIVMVLVLADLATLPVRAAADGDQAHRTPGNLCGRLTEYKGLPVLELWGNPEQAGYAHGYLLAERITRLIDGYMLDASIIGDKQIYEGVLMPAVRRQFNWPADSEAELTALLEGMKDRLGADAVRSRVLDREIRLEDLMATNVLADWFGMRCSSISVWGSRSADGQTVTARNLDFPSTAIMAHAQLIVIRRGHHGRHSWIGVSWPGMIGVYTAMSSEGVTMLMHDACGLKPTEASGFTPRSLILREALEQARAESFVEDVHGVFRRRRVMVGNNIHVSGPTRAGRPAAVVFEYDANTNRDDGVTVRTAESGGEGLEGALWCTNHHRLRQSPRAGWRYRRLGERLEALAKSGSRLDPAGALQLIREVKQDITLHSVCLTPIDKTMRVMIPACGEGVVEFKLDEWLRRATVAGPESAAYKGGRP